MGYPLRNRERHDQIETERDSQRKIEREIETER